MKKDMKLKKIILFGMVAMAFTACDDLIDPALENNMDITQMYTNPEIARGILDNAWLVLPFDENPTTDVATDDAVSNDVDNSYKKMALGQWTASTNPMNQWEARYHSIQYCNLFLENTDQVEWSYSNPALSTMYNDNYKGNAYGLRGLHMFHLLRAHCGMVGGVLMGVPIHTSSEDGGSDFNQPRATFKECIDQIMSDFDEALKYLPVEYGNVDMSGVPEKYKEIGANDGAYNRAFGDHHRGKLDGRIISALKAQVALFAASPAYASAGAMTYEQAAKYAVECLKYAHGTAACGIAPDGWHWFNQTSYIDSYSFTDPDPDEIVWRGIVGESSSLEEDNYPPSLDGKGRVNPTQNLVDAFPAANGYPITDPKSNYNPENPYSNRDPRLKEYIVYNGSIEGVKSSEINTTEDSDGLDGINHEAGKSTITGYYLRKLLREDVNVTSSTKQKHFGARIRFTEIFLDYAEAANEAQGPQAKVGGASFSAYDVIKALRARVHKANWKDEYLESIKGDKDKMRELIRNERRLELCFENHRFWDLRRWNLNLTESAKGVYITTVNPMLGQYIYSVREVEPRAYKNYMYYGPIPYLETQKWDQLLQNDGWSSTVNNVE